MHLAANFGIATKEQVMPREFLYLTDEIFCRVLQQRLHPYRVLIALGRVGPVEKTMQEGLVAVIRGENEKSKE